MGEASGLGCGVSVIVAALGFRFVLQTANRDFWLLPKLRSSLVLSKRRIEGDWMGKCKRSGCLCGKGLTNHTQELALPKLTALVAQACCKSPTEQATHDGFVRDDRAGRSARTNLGSRGRLWPLNTTWDEQPSRKNLSKCRNSWRSTNKWGNKREKM